MILFESERGRVVLEVEREPFLWLKWMSAPATSREDSRVTSIRWWQSLWNGFKSPYGRGKAVIAKQKIKRIIALKVRPGKATLSVLTNESDDVALYSYVSRDKTITPINFYNFLEKAKNPEWAPYHFQKLSHWRHFYKNILYNLSQIFNELKSLNITIEENVEDEVDLQFWNIRWIRTIERNFRPGCTLD